MAIKTIFGQLFLFSGEKNMMSVQYRQNSGSRKGFSIWGKRKARNNALQLYPFLLGFFFCHVQETHLNCGWVGGWVVVFLRFSKILRFFPRPKYSFGGTGIPHTFNILSPIFVPEVNIFNFILETNSSECPRWKNSSNKKRYICLFLYIFGPVFLSVILFLLKE